MKLHEAESPNARRVWIFMKEKGIDCERVPVDIRAGENLKPEYLAKNPMGRVPVLELDDGSFLAESVAICRGKVTRGLRLLDRRSRSRTSKWRATRLMTASGETRIASGFPPERMRNSGSRSWLTGSGREPIPPCGSSA